MELVLPTSRLSSETETLIREWVDTDGDGTIPSQRSDLDLGRTEPAELWMMVAPMSVCACSRLLACFVHGGDVAGTVNLHQVMSDDVAAPSASEPSSVAQPTLRMQIQRAPDEWFEFAFASSMLVETFGSIAAPPTTKADEAGAETEEECKGTEGGALNDEEAATVSHLHTVVSMPRQTQCALGALSHHLQPFHLSRVLRGAGRLWTWSRVSTHVTSYAVLVAVCFHLLRCLLDTFPVAGLLFPVLVPFQSHACMRVSGTTLHDLEVFKSAVGAVCWRGFVFFLQDSSPPPHTHTPKTRVSPSRKITRLSLSLCSCPPAPRRQLALPVGLCCGCSPTARRPLAPACWRSGCVAR